MKKTKHIHKLRRINIGGFQKLPYLVYKCTLPGCEYYISEKLIQGKHSLCNRCNEPFTIKTVPSITLAIPHCDDCTKRSGNKVKKSENLDKLLEEMFRGKV